MPVVPNGTQFAGIKSGEDVSSKKSALAAAYEPAYTIEDIAAKITEIQSTTTTTTTTTAP